MEFDYLDLYLIHQPFNDYYGLWRAMDNFVFDSNGKLAIYVFSPIFGIKVKFTFSIGIEREYYTNVPPKRI